MQANDRPQCQRNAPAKNVAFPPISLIYAGVKRSKYKLACNKIKDQDFPNNLL